MSEDTVERVHEFHVAFGQDIMIEPGLPENTEDERILLVELSQELKRIANIAHDLAKAKPGNRNFLRLQLITEETSELAQAMADKDLVEVLDALVDLTYVVDGTYDVNGLKDLKAQAFDDVHRSNMSKLGEDGKPILNEAGRIQKGPNYFPPNLDAVVERYFHSQQAA
jgi:predicted HAD superfamily Cof-like phosphohydrolase